MPTSTRAAKRPKGHRADVGIRPYEQTATRCVGVDAFIDPCRASGPKPVGQMREMEVPMLPNRKQTRLSGYNYAENGAYFITICTNNKEKLLGSILEGTTVLPASVQLSHLGQLAEKYLLRIAQLDHYVIMPNHVHLILLLQQPSISVPQIIRSWKIMVSKEAGFSPWQRSYYDHIIRNQSDYDRIRTYMEENPARWASDDYYIK